MRGPPNALVTAALLAALGIGCAHQTVSATDPLVGNVQRGRALFTKSCANCHGATGVEGDIGPSLRFESRRKDLDATIVWIHHPRPPMPTLYPSPLTATDVVDIATYVQSL
jgi:mono/diheme cytochrome c family protein